MTTKGLLEAFGFGSLRDLPDLERTQGRRAIGKRAGEAELDSGLGLTGEGAEDTFGDNAELDGTGAF